MECILSGAIIGFFLGTTIAFLSEQFNRIKFWWKYLRKQNNNSKITQKWITKIMK